MMDGSVPDGTVVVVSYDRRRRHPGSPGLRLSGRGHMLAYAPRILMSVRRGLHLLGTLLLSPLLKRDSNQVPAGLCVSERGCRVAHAPVIDEPVPVGTFVVVSNAVGREQPGLSRSAPFLVVMLNCADMLRSSLLARIRACAPVQDVRSGFDECCLQLMLLSSTNCIPLYCHAPFPFVFPRDVEERTHTHSCSRAHDRIYRLLYLLRSDRDILHSITFKCLW